MLPDENPTPQGSEIEPINPQDAAIILKQALEPYLADGWRVLDQSAYYARVTRGTRNLDILVDLLGQVEKRESELTPLQDSGRLAAWMLLLATLLVVMALATALGII